MNATAAERVFLEAFRDGWRPDPILTVSQWAEEHRQLSSATSAEPANFRYDRTPYFREPIDALSAQHPARRVVIMAGAQLGKTEGGLNWIGYVIQSAPGPMMMVQPAIDDAEAVSKERIAPMLALTPVLAELVSENRSRQGDNTILVKKFRGGMLAIAGANSARSLRGRPIRYLYVDEIDAYPTDVDGEGDPVALAEKRMTTFTRRKVLLTSTPKIKGFSRIEAEFNASDQRRYFVPCPHCGHRDWIRWQSIVYHDNDPSTAALLCGACGVLIEERFKTQMLAAGEWRPTAESREGTLGYHLSGLYSPLGWLSWREVVAEFLAAKQDPSKLKVWVNTRLAEPWEERAEAVDPASLLERARRTPSWPADVPAGVGVLVASVDVQADRLEWKVKGFGAGEESWLIATGQIAGDPERDAVWHELDATVLQQAWTHESGQVMRVDCTAIDSRFKSDAVYKFCRARAARRVFAVMGDKSVGRPLVGRPTANNKYRARLYMLCVDTGKETVYSRLRIQAPGPGFVHLPNWVDEEYIAQLTAEKAVRRFIRGRGSVREWVATRDRNEALDLEVYALAALKILGEPFIRTLATRAARFATLALQLGGAPTGGEAEAGAAPEPPAPAGSPRPRRRSRWVYGGGGWKA